MRKQAAALVWGAYMNACMVSVVALYLPARLYDYLRRG